MDSAPEINFREEIVRIVQFLVDFIHRLREGDEEAVFFLVKLLDIILRLGESFCWKIHSILSTSKARNLTLLRFKYLLILFLLLVYVAMASSLSS